MSLIENKKATYNYDIIDTLEAGIELFGFEVKSLRQKRGSLEGSYITIKDNEAYLINALIPPYQAGNTPKEYNERRPRKLLLKKNELKILTGKSETKGLTFIPLSLYNKNIKIKLSFAVARGKKAHDKRSAVKKRETDREIRRILKNER